MKKQLKALLWCLIAGVAVGTGGLLLDGFAAPERWLYDQRQRVFRADLPAPTDIVIIMLDEHSLAALKSDLGRFPWPRHIYADVLDFIALGEPRAVVFDILFTEPESLFNQVSDNDRRLTEASSALPTTHAARLLLDGDGVQPASDVSVFQIGRSATYHSDDALWVPPIEPLAEAARAVGFVDLLPDADGVVRQTALHRPYQQAVLPSLGIAALRAAGWSHWTLSEHALVASTGLAIPATADGLYDIAFYGRFNEISFSALVASAKQVYEGSIDNLLIHPDEFRDKMVFIGASAAGLDDLRPNPLAAAVPGVRIHASVVGNVLAGDFLHRTPHWVTGITVVMLPALIGAAVLFGIRLLWQIALPIGALGGFVLLGFQIFAHGWIVNLAAPLAAGLATWFSALGYVNVVQGKDRRKVRRLLVQYVSPSVLAAIVDKYEDVIRAEVGTRENVTILFSDVRAFTTLSEDLQAEQVVSLLNVHFGVMTEIIFRYDGTLDKFIGDAIMAFWGAPLRTSDHAEHAVRAALDMVRAIETVNAMLQERGLPAIRIGIGLNSGEVVLGNIGSERKLDYTVIGDNVNLASRMEGLTGKYGCTVLLSEATYSAVAEKIPCVLIDRVRVKGKHQPIGIYVPLELLRGIVEENRWNEAGTLMNEAFAHYCAQRWDSALAAYDKAPFAGIAALFRDRCRAYREQPPDADWKGVTTLDSK